MLGNVADWILRLHGWVALAVVFLLPALESSVFVGFVFPGEIAVLLGGVLAADHHVRLESVIVAGIAGAVVGDSVGYEVGRRWGRRLLQGALGRFVTADHLDRAGRYLQSKGGKAVFFGRFTAALRVLIPGMAGMSAMPYRRFLAYNAAGGAVWATGFVVAGYLAGHSWQRVEHVAGRASVVLLLLLVLVGAVVLTARWVDRHQVRLLYVVADFLERPAVARLRARYNRQFGFLARRFQPGGAFGLSLTASLVALVGVGWALGAVVQDVVAGDGAIRFDGPVLHWFVDHREPWLNTTMQVVTTLGSSAVLIPLVLALGAWFWRRHHTLRPFTLLALAYGGSYVLSQSIKVLVGRPRPPAGLVLGHYSSYAFPSGHSTEAAAVYGMLAVVLAAATPRWPRKVACWTAAILIVTLVGITRLYLAAHWLTDVLGGWSFGTLWFLLVLAAAQAVTGWQAIRSSAVEPA